MKYNYSQCQVLRSAAGYYIGTLDEDGLPDSRVSVEYYPTFAAAEAALREETFTPREHAIEWPAIVEAAGLTR